MQGMEKHSNADAAMTCIIETKNYIQILQLQTMIDDYGKDSLGGHLTKMHWVL